MAARPKDTQPPHSTGDRKTSSRSVHRSSANRPPHKPIRHVCRKTRRHGVPSKAQNATPPDAPQPVSDDFRLLATDGSTTPSRPAAPTPQPANATNACASSGNSLLQPTDLQVRVAPLREAGLTANPTRNSISSPLSDSRKKDARGGSIPHASQFLNTSAAITSDTNRGRGLRHGCGIGSGHSSDYLLALRIKQRRVAGAFSRPVCHRVSYPSVPPERPQRPREYSHHCMPRGGIKLVRVSGRANFSPRLSD
jgi:hypothetical protein